jgi:hypothetical protein
VTIIPGDDSLKKIIPHQKIECQKSIISMILFFKAAVISSVTVVVTAQVVNRSIFAIKDY